MKNKAWYDRAQYTPEEAGKIAWKIGINLWDNAGRPRRERAADALTLYLGHASTGLDSVADVERLFTGDVDPPGFNVIQSFVDTKVAHHVRNKTRVVFLTDGGDYALQSKAKGLQRIVETTLHDFGLYGDAGIAVTFDSQIFDGACFKVFPDYQNMRVVGVRVFPWEVNVSRREGRYGKPRTVSHVYTIDRAVLLGTVDPEDTEKRRAIEDASAADVEKDDALDADEIADEVRVVELWHIPSTRVDTQDPKTFGLNEEGVLDASVDPGHDGRHIITIDGCVLLDEPYPFDYPQVHTLRPLPKPVGYWSRSVPETFAGAQLLLNAMSDRIDRILHMHARPLLYVYRRAKLNTRKIDNDVATILEGDVPPGQAVHYITPQSVPSDYLQRFDRVVERCMQQAGLSEMSISARKPAGVNHAPGLQHLSDEESVRHSTEFRAFENFFLSVARGVLDSHRLLARHAKRVGIPYKVALCDDKRLTRVDFAKFDLRDHKYRLDIWPANLLPQTPGAKTSRVIDLMQAGLLSDSPEAKRALRLIDMPDLAKATGDDTAVLENIERKLDEVMKHGVNEDTAPHPYMDLALAVRVCAERINRMEADGEDFTAIDNLIMFHEHARAELERLQPPAPTPTQGTPA